MLLRVGVATQGVQKRYIQDDGYLSGDQIKRHLFEGHLQQALGQQLAKDFSPVNYHNDDEVEQHLS